MDDLTITTDTHIQARWILTALEETVQHGQEWHLNTENQDH